MAPEIIRIFGAAVFAIALAASPAHAACDIESGIAAHNAARDGDDAAIEEAISCLENIRAQSPENARMLAYLGSAYAIKAREADAVSDKMRFTNFGLDDLDYAVELAPDDFELRVIRWNVNRAVPEMFGRKKHLTADSRKLDTLFRQSQSPRMARVMVPVYKALVTLEPADAAVWQEWRAKAESLAKEADK